MCLKEIWSTLFKHSESCVTVSLASACSLPLPSISSTSYLCACTSCRISRKVHKPPLVASSLDALSCMVESDQRCGKHRKRHQRIQFAGMHHGRVSPKAATVQSRAAQTMPFFLSEWDDSAVAELDEPSSLHQQPAVRVEKRNEPIDCRFLLFFVRFFLPTLSTMAAWIWPLLSLSALLQTW